MTETTKAPAGWDYVDTSVEDDCVDEIDHDDWVTSDGVVFRHHGSGEIVLDTTDLSDAQAARSAGRIMRAEGFFPNVWYVSDHGNVSAFTFE